MRAIDNDAPPEGPDDDDPPAENEPGPDLRHGEYALACGHKVTTTLDTQERTRCPKCHRDTFVLNIIR